MKKKQEDYTWIFIKKGTKLEVLNYGNLSILYNENEKYFLESLITYRKLYNWSKENKYFENDDFLVEKKDVVRSVMS